MARREHHAQGSFAWLELEAHDRDAAAEFYGRLLGWRFRPAGDALAAALGDDVVAQVSGGAERARWRSFVTVSDARAAAGAARALGATVGEPRADDELGVRVAVRDPDGAAFSLWQPGAGAYAARQNEPGALAWNELWTAELERAFAFYGALVGWSRVAPPHGAADYLLLGSPQRPGWTNGGLRATPALAAPFWLPYFEVVDCDAAVALTVAGGGRIRSPAVTIPRVGRLAAVHDPDGAALGLMTSAA